MAASTAYPQGQNPEGQPYSQIGYGDATRHSVAKTQRAFAGTPIAASTVTSDTKGLIVAYPGVEINT